jgi:hypothetical protein
MEVDEEDTDDEDEDDEEVNTNFLLTLKQVDFTTSFSKHRKKRSSTPQDRMTFSRQDGK